MMLHPTISSCMQSKGIPVCSPLAVAAMLLLSQPAQAQSSAPASSVVQPDVSETATHPAPAPMPLLLPAQYPLPPSPPLAYLSPSYSYLDGWQSPTPSFLPMVASLPPILGKTSKNVDPPEETEPQNKGSSTKTAGGVMLGVGLVLGLIGAFVTAAAESSDDGREGYGGYANQAALGAGVVLLGLGGVSILIGIPLMAASSD